MTSATVTALISDFGMVRLTSLASGAANAVCSTPMKKKRANGMHAKTPPHPMGNRPVDASALLVASFAGEKCGATTMQKGTERKHRDRTGQQSCTNAALSTP